MKKVLAGRYHVVTNNGEVRLRDVNSDRMVVVPPRLAEILRTKVKLPAVGDYVEIKSDVVLTAASE